MSAVATIARALHLLLLSVWIGAGVFLLGVVAPDVFASVSSRQIAGETIARIVADFDLYGLIAGPSVLFTLLLGYGPLGVKLRIRAALAIAMTVLVAVSGQWLTPRMFEVQIAMGRPIEEVAPTDPLRIQFMNLHFASEVLLALHVILAVLLLLSTVAGSTPKRRNGIEL